MGKRITKLSGESDSDYALRRITEYSQHEPFVRSGMVTPCRVWGKSSLWDGYGQIRHGGGMHRVHRLSYLLAVGPIPEGEDGEALCVCHRCDNRLCVNPDHLFLDTHAGNMRDMKAKGRANPARGENHGNAKLSDADVTRVRELRSRGWSLRKIASDAGCSYQNIQLILTGKSRSSPTQNMAEQQGTGSEKVC